MTEWIVTKDGWLDDWCVVGCIIRCRDCKHFTESMAWPGAHECDFINRGVEPDGYCAWGEWREA